MASMTRWVRPDTIKTDPAFDLFPIRKQELAAITASMEQDGYDESQPIVVWKLHSVAVEGRTRHAAAKAAGLKLIAIHERDFSDYDAAKRYAYARQIYRRNLTAKERAGAVAQYLVLYDEHKQAGGDHQSAEALASIDANALGKSAEVIAEELGVSQATVERSRAVLDSDDEETKGQLLAGEIATDAAYKKVTEKKQEAKTEKAAKAVHPTYSVSQWSALSADERAQVLAESDPGEAFGFNKQDTDNIEWAKWSWNPVTGCLHDCPYCYARDIANHFYEQKFIPTFIPERLAAPFYKRVPAQATQELGYRNVFTCSMADLFGKWVPAEWIEHVLDMVRQCPQWNFLFLTKFPVRLAEFTFPENAWLGTTVDCQARVKNAERSFAKVQGGVKWLSIEPMLEPLHFTSLEMFNWVVIGGASQSSQTPEWIPPRRWVLDLESAARDAGCMIYEKTNLGISGPSRLREYPGWQREEASLPRALAYLPSIEQGV